MKHLILFIALLVSNGLAIARTTMSDQLSKTTRMNTQSEIYFAGGCFWGTEHFMKQIDGVTNTPSRLREREESTKPDLRTSV